MGHSSPKSAVAEHPFRSLAKAVSWRATGTLDTIVVAAIITGRVKVALSIGLVELFTKLCLYYLHERVWNRIPFGKVRVKEDYEI
jgi:uncharacterized membrane protein